MAPPRVSLSFHSYSSFFSVPSRRRERVGGHLPPRHAHPVPPPSRPASAGACGSARLSGPALQPPIPSPSSTGPDPSPMGSQRPRASTRLSLLCRSEGPHTSCPQTPPPTPSRPPCEGAGRCYMCVYTCRYVRTYMQCPVLPKKAPFRPVPIPCALTSGTAPARGRLPPSPSVPFAPSPRAHPGSREQGGCPGGPRGSGPASSEQQTPGVHACPPPHTHTRTYGTGSGWVSIPLLSA